MHARGNMMGNMLPFDEKRISNAIILFIPKECLEEYKIKNYIHPTIYNQQGFIRSFR